MTEISNDKDIGDSIDHCHRASHRPGAFVRAEQRRRWR
jgi:hypothetical protein